MKTKKIHLIKEKCDYEDIRYLEKMRNVQLLIGFVLLIPPILGVVLFTLAVFGVNDDIVQMKELSANWTGDSNAMSSAPIYLGLMAIAGSFMVYSGFRNFVHSMFIDEGLGSIEDMEIKEFDEEGKDDNK